MPVFSGRAVGYSSGEGRSGYMAFDIDFMRSYDRESLAEELRRIATLTGKRTVTVRDLKLHGRVCGRTVTLKFGSMGKANEAAGLVPSPVRKWTTDELLNEVRDLWRKTLEDLGRSPLACDVRRYRLPLSACVIAKRFGSWKNALLAASEATDLEMPGPPVRTGRRRKAVSPTTRFLVFKRDLYTCRICRCSGVALVLDHVIPVSRGGSDAMENLQVLCVPCNQGKGSSLQ